MKSSEDKIKNLLSDAKLLSLSPGVYKMFDKAGNIIYVGKSKFLRNRVSQYFQNIDSHNYKTRKMVENVDRFECVYTDTENEALVLENELIKLHHPKFNIRLKDDKSYPYVTVTTSEKYPRVRFVRSSNITRNKKDKYFGPYSSSSSAYDIIDTVNKIFKLPTCKLNFPEDFGKRRPCLNYHIDRCSGVCSGNVSEEKYAETIKSVIMFLKSEYEEVLKELNIKMLNASDNLLFEEASVYRDLISSIKNLRQHQKIIFDDSTQRDVFGYYSDDFVSCISVSIIREGRIIDSERFIFKNGEILDADTFLHFLLEYYSQREYFPKEILIPFEFFSEDISSLSEHFSKSKNKNVKILSPEKGELRKIVMMASENAREYSEHKRSIDEKNESKLVELAVLLGLEVVPEKIEAYDVSNSSTEHTVAGMISIRNGLFNKKGYKLFNIRESKLDDYAATREALTRRFNRYIEEKNRLADVRNWDLPDLILMDGGVGHVSVAREVLDNFNLSIPVFGMVKDEHHKTRTLVDTERELSISLNPRIFNFIYGIQEEIHRFTFSAMDKKRLKTVKHFSIEKIEGIGPKKAKTLMSHFKTVKKLKEATVEQIASVKGISKKDAVNIFNFYEKAKNE